MGGSSVSTRHLTVPIARMVASRAAVDITNNQEVDISKVVVEVASAAAAVVDTTAEDMVTTTMETAVVQATAVLAVVVVMVVVVMVAAMVCTSARCRQFWYLQRSLESIYTQLERTNSFRRWRW